MNLIEVKSVLFGQIKFHSVHSHNKNSEGSEEVTDDIGNPFSLLNTKFGIKRITWESLLHHIILFKHFNQYSQTTFKISLFFFLLICNFF